MFFRRMRYIVFEVLHMYKTFGETIASLRRAHGMRQQALAEAMAEAGIPVSNQAVSKLSLIHISEPTRP